MRRSLRYRWVGVSFFAVAFFLATGASLAEDFLAEALLASSFVFVLYNFPFHVNVFLPAARFRLNAAPNDSGFLLEDAAAFLGFSALALRAAAFFPGSIASL